MTFYQLFTAIITAIYHGIILMGWMVIFYCGIQFILNQTLGRFLHWRSKRADGKRKAEIKARLDAAKHVRTRKWGE